MIYKQALFINRFIRAADFFPRGSGEKLLAAWNVFISLCCSTIVHLHSFQSVEW